MLRYKTIDIDTSSTGQSLTDALISIGDRKRIIRSIRFELVRYPALLAYAKTLPKAVAYLDTDQVVSANFGSFVEGTFSSAGVLMGECLCRLDMPIQAGQKFQVGADVAYANELIHATIEYEDQ